MEEIKKKNYNKLARKYDETNLSLTCKKHTELWRLKQ